MTDRSRRHVLLISRLAPAALVALALGCGTAAAAESDFYAGKQITLIGGAAAGGGYDLLARLMARHLGKHIPGQSDHHRAEHAGGRQPRRHQSTSSTRRRRTAP